MAFSYEQYVGDGTTTAYGFSFEGQDQAYIREDDIVVVVDGTNVPFTFTSTNTLELDTAPSNGAEVLIRRVMPKNVPYADFSSGNNFGQDILNNSFLQLLYVVHELLDGWFPAGFTVREAVQFLENVDFGKDVTVGEDLTVEGNTSTGGNLSTGGSFSANDGASFGDDVTIDGALAIAGTLLGITATPSDPTSAVNFSAGDVRYLRKIGGALSGALSMGGNKITDLAKPTALSDAARLADVQAAIIGDDADLITFDEYLDLPESSVQQAIETVYNEVEEVHESVELTARSFGNVASLVAADVAIGRTVMTRGYNTEGDGGANYYKIVAGATGTADGGAYIDLANGLQAQGLFLFGHNIKQWGAVCDGSTGDADAVEAALIYTVANGLDLTAYPETVLERLITINSTSAPFKLLNGVFVVTNSDGGIKFFVSDIAHRVVISSHFEAGIQGSGFPFEVVFPLPDPVSWRTQTLILDRVECRPRVFNNSQYRWTKGVRLVNAWHAQCFKFYFNGAENGNMSCEYGIKTEQYSVNVDYVACYATNVGDGFWAGGESEGPRYLSTNTVVGKVGFRLEGNTANPQAVIIGCHTNCVERGVLGVDWNGIVVDDCEFYRLAQTAGYKDVEVIGGQDLKVINSRAALGPQNENWFVYLNNHRNATVKDNQLTSRWHHVECVGTTAYTNASNNRQEDAVNTEAEELLDNSTGSNNKLEHWRMQNWNSVHVSANGTTNDVAPGSDTVITLNSVRFNDQVGFSAGNPTRITVPDWCHSVEISGGVDFPTRNVGVARIVKIRKNGTQIVAKTSSQPVGGANTTLNIAPTRVFASAGDYFELLAFQDSDLTLNLSQTDTYLAMKPISSGS